MITKQEILGVADETGLRPSVVEKDWVLGWLLAAINAALPAVSRLSTVQWGHQLILEFQRDRETLWFARVRFESGPHENERELVIQQPIFIVAQFAQRHLDVRA